MEQGRITSLGSLAQDPHLVKLFQHNLARQDSKFPGQGELSWAVPLTREKLSIPSFPPSSLFLLLLLSSPRSTSLQCPYNDSTTAFA